MKKYIALLKGINVGGHKKISMAELRELLSNTGLQHVQTYIQSGNVMFQSSEKNALKLEENIQKTVKSHFGFDVSVIIKTPSEFQTIFNACPFSQEGEKEKSYFILLNKTPDANLVHEAMQISHENETVIIKNDCLYFYSAAGYGQAKFNMTTFERKLNVVGTARNYNTMVKLLSLCAEI